MVCYPEHFLSCESDLMSFETIETEIEKRQKKQTLQHTSNLNVQELFKKTE